MRYEFDEKGGCSRIRAAALVGILAMAFNVEAAPRLLRQRWTL